MLSSIGWYLFINVSGQLVDPISTLDDETDMLSQNAVTNYQSALRNILGG